MATEHLEGTTFRTTGGINYRRISSTFGEGLDDCYGEEELVILATDLNEFLDEALPRQNTAVVGGFPRIYLPRTMPGRDHLSTVRVDVESFNRSRPFDPFGLDETIIPGGANEETYSPFALVKIRYEAISRDFFREVNLHAGAEYLQIPPSKLGVSDDPNGSPVDTTNTNGAVASVSTEANKDNLLAAYKLIPTIEWTYKLQPFVNVQWETYFGLLGRINDRRSTDLCEGAYAGTVMFSGVSATRYYSMYRVAGTPWLMELKFSQRCVNEIINGETKHYGWNHHYSSNTNAGKGGWTMIERAPLHSGKYLYEYSDLARNLLTAILN